MNYDKRQCEEAIKARAKRHQAKVTNMDSQIAEFLRQSAVRSELLTRDENWDVYLTRIQEHVNRSMATLNSARLKLEDPTIWSTEELYRIKSVAIEAKAMINAFNIAISIPGEIIKERKKLTDDLK